MHPATSNLTATTGMQRLPVELHGRIFTQCLPDDRYVPAISTQAPLLLVQVCRRWRSVALQTPQLWCSLDATTGDDVEEVAVMWKGRVDLYSIWLSRSGSLPLSLAVSFSKDYPSLSDGWLRVVRSYSGRVKQFRVVDEIGVDISLLAKPANLKHLFIEGLSEECTHGLAQHRPYLQALALDMHHALPAASLDGEWIRLTRLAVRLPDGAGYEFHRLLALLDRCPNLTALTFGPITPGDLHQPSRSHLSLRNLTVSIDSDGSVADEDPHPTLTLPGVLVLRVQCTVAGDLEEGLWPDEGLGLIGILDPEDSIEDQLASGLTTGPPHRACSMRVEDDDQTFHLLDPCWWSITHLHLEVRGSTGVFGTAIKLCANLKVLILNGRHCTTRCTYLPEPLTHAKLIHVSIAVWSELGDFLLRATLPGLRELSISAVSYGEPEHIRDFLTRSGCPLETLRVHAKRSRSWTEEEVAEVRGVAPTLTVLNLRCLSN